ncbi:Translation proteins SH3-like protein [Glarea lozoyensis ATCC 20868]|uniref:Translation proteins SH3-like protein n=1 Tax=Glarea lozoyensis (strain ATCC 20868 / MF5171) TaxID=1116229 RepID=S3D9N8_GLAL2|nr:Translation proteins SH3-like protein [Glarea lozoyensis ATCC 20868]EPE33829.1 Translation proteins SH3-like protein [Glarea lozoyensis ATCC 20868]
MATTTPTLRPLSCWKTLLRQSSMQKVATRSLTTYFKPKPIDPPKRPHHKLKVYPPPPSAKAAFKEPIKEVTASQLAILDPTGGRTTLFSKANTEAAKVGDILLVRLKNGDPFAGVCINIRRRGVDSGILLRNELTRVGVEMWFKIYSPNVEGIEVVQRKEKRARRARLTYMRKPKHDVGSVQNIVLAYQRTRGALRGNVEGGPVGHENKGGKRKIRAKGKGKK